MHLNTLLTINLTLTLVALSVFMLTLSILLAVLRKNLRSNHITASSITSAEIDDKIVHSKAPTTATKQSSHSNNLLLLPFSLLNNPSQSGYLSRSFASKAALDKKVFSRGLKEIF